jgi:hypothetical protein
VVPELPNPGPDLKTNIGTRRAAGALSTDYASDLSCAASVDIARGIMREAQL